MNSPPDNEYNYDHNIEKIIPGEFPELLQEIADPPRQLHVRGSIEILYGERLKICIIGSRKHSPYGDEVTKSIIAALAPYSPIIVSGLATGIDTLALEYALDNGLPCIAILGGGIDDATVYPRENLALAHRIMKNKGVLISEFPPGTPPEKWRFPMRNRIMAGLSDAIVIIEGTKKSGTLITARLGLDFGRDIICVPGSIFSELSAGPLSLIEQGAIPLTHPTDIVRILDLKDDSLPTDPNNGYHLFQDATSEHEKYSRCTSDERRLIDILNQPCQRDELAEKTGFSASVLQITITMLEIKGFIAEKYGKIVRL